MALDDGEARLAALLEEIREEVPGFRLLSKRDSRFQRLLHGLLVGLTFGGQRGYLDRYVTTIGRTVYVDLRWEERAALDRWATLRHERVHLRQFQRWGLVGMALLYLLVPLPVGLAWCRMRFEREAYEESIRALRDAYGAEYLRRPSVRARMIEQFTGPAYGWMWPFPRAVARWYDRHCPAGHDGVAEPSVPRVRP